MTHTRALAFVTLLVAACTDGERPCQQFDRAQGDFAPQLELRDPQTGMCQGFGGGGCDDACGPCAETDVVAQPDWAQCFAQCEGLGEATCKTTSGCRAVYAGDAFHQCWGTAPSGPIQGGTCAGLDAQECSRHDDCVAKHAIASSGQLIGNFQSCAAEGSVQDPGSCVGQVTCTTQPPQCPANTIAGRRNGCWTGYCIPYAQCDQLPACNTLEEMDCISRTDCAPTYEGQNCSCTPSGCTCQNWVFDVCKMR